MSRRPSAARGASVEGTHSLLIDGNNLLHRVAGGVDPGALRGLLARLRALPETVATTLMLDGHPAPGTDRRQRIERNLHVQHSGSLSADDALLNIVRDLPAHARSGATVVTDDRALSERARHLGAHTQRLDWLDDVLAGARPSPATAIGQGRPRTPPPTAAAPGEEREPWKPGRGATRKRGNPRRAAH